MGKKKKWQSGTGCFKVLCHTLANSTTSHPGTATEESNINLEINPNVELDSESTVHIQRGVMTSKKAVFEIK